MSSLPCFRRMFADALNDDGLLVLARGIGVKVLLCKFIKLHASALLPGKIILILNANGVERLLGDLLLGDGLPEARLPLKIDSDLPAGERVRLYETGGVFYITPRILVVDILMNRLRREAVEGFLVHAAERVVDGSNEAFVLRLYREANATGFIKAFSEEPDVLVSGFGRLEKTMRALFAKKVFLWPRFHVLMAGDLDASPPEVIECSQPMTETMTAIQKGIVQCMDASLAELKRLVKFEFDELSIEDNLFESFDVLIRRQLDPIWNTVKPRAKQLIADLKTLRKLLNYLVRYDAVSFYLFLDMLRLSSLQQTVPSEWLRSEAGERIFRAAKARLYVIRQVEPSRTLSNKVADLPLEVVEPERDELGRLKLSHGKPIQKVYGMEIVLEHNPKWQLLLEVLDEIKASLATWPQGSAGARILIAVKDERAANQLKEVLAAGPDVLLNTSFTRLLVKQSSRTKNVRHLVLQSESLASVPHEWNGTCPLSGAEFDGDAASHVGQWQRMIPPDEIALWRAAEIPGWPDKSDSTTVRKPSPPPPGLHKLPGNASESATLVDLAEGLGLINQQGGESDKATTMGAKPAANVAPSLQTRPYVVPEQRLLWKAACQAMERERQTILRSHAEVLATVDGDIDAGNSNPASSASLAELMSTQSLLDAFTTLDGGDIDDVSTEHELEERERPAPLPDTSMGDSLQPIAAMIAESQKGNAGSSAAARSLQAALTGEAVPEVGMMADATLMDDQVKEMLRDALGAKVSRRATSALNVRKVGSHGDAPPNKRSCPDPSPKESSVREGPARILLHSSTDRRQPIQSSDRVTNPTLLLLRAYQGVRGKQKRGESAKSFKPAVPTSSAGTDASFSNAGKLPIVIFPLSRMDDRFPLLNDLQPTFIIAYDPDPTFTREVEVYKATLAKAVPVRVYFLVYEVSAEQQKYLSSIKKERQAFERLVAEKAHIAPVALSHGPNPLNTDAPGTIRKGTPDGWGITLDGARSAAKSNDGLAALIGRSVAPSLVGVRPLTVDICCPDKGKRKIIIDMREFRAKLPMRLYNIGLDTIPATLEVGDFVLSPDMCVERKSVPDLFGSFNSGRLYTQAQAMTKYYKRALLCIEFDEDRPFSLQSTPDMPQEIEITNPVSKIVLLTLHFPTLRILWSRTPLATATAFASFKQLQDEPDEVAAASIGCERGLSAGGDLDDAAGVGLSKTNNFVGLDFLRKLPGVSAANYAKLIRAAPTLAEVARLSEPQLVALMGEGNAGLLYSFLHTKNSTGL